MQDRHRHSPNSLATHGPTIHEGQTLPFDIYYIGPLQFRQQTFQVVVSLSSSTPSMSTGG